MKQLTIDRKKTFINAQDDEEVRFSRASNSLKMFEEVKKRREKIRFVETVPTYLRICRVRVDIEFLENILALEKTDSTMQEMMRKYVAQELDMFLQVARKRCP